MKATCVTVKNWMSHVFFVQTDRIEDHGDSCAYKSLQTKVTIHLQVLRTICIKLFEKYNFNL